MSVVDASVLIEYLLSTPAAAQIERVLLSNAAELHAPHVLDLEVAHVVRRLVALGEITAERGRTALLDLSAFPIERHAHTHLLSRIWEMRRNVTAYDAAYLALAEGLRTKLLTRDARLAAAAGHRTTIELI